MKLFHEFARQWRIGVMLACACVLTFAGLQLAADDSGLLDPDVPDAPANVDVDSENESVDLDGQVEITVSGGIRSRTRTAHSTSVTVRNISDDPIEGPLALVIDAAGLDVLEVVESDGKLASGEPYLEILAEDASLRSGRSLRPKRVQFTSEAAIPLAERNGFDPEFRVVRLTEEDQLADADDDENLPGKSYSQAEIDGVMEIQDSWTARLLRLGNGSVYGTATAEDDQGNLVVRVFTERPGIIRDLPGEVDGIPLQQEVIGAPFVAGGGPVEHVIYVDGEAIPTPQPDDGADDAGPAPGSDRPAGGPDASNDGDTDPQFTGTPGDPTVRFSRPVPIGISSFNFEQPCNAGTLGCRLVDSTGAAFGLSNNHVWGGYIAIINHPRVGGAVAVVGIPGDRIVQPATFDKVPACTFDPSDQIGVVADYEPILLAPGQICFLGLAPVNFMDATIMRADPGALHYCTPPDGYGAPRRGIATPRLGMLVQKYGRTTVYTSGTITSLNGTTCILYAPNLFGYFIKQIEIANTMPFGHPFSQGGDSGSLIVALGGEDDGKPVSLNFAGGPRGAYDVSITNPIGPVLTRFGMQVDDGSGAPGAGLISGTGGGVVGELDPPPPLP